VVPFFREVRKTGRVPITDPRMTRFWITLDHGVRFVIESIRRAHGGELFVPKIPSTDIMTLAEVLTVGCEKDVVGIRPGEKLHELMIGQDDARRTRDMGNYYVVQPQFQWWNGDNVAEGMPVADGFSYRSDTNPDKLNASQVQTLLASLDLL
jgi:UDP-N-acetylglucosamine 4,6-dehydratase/5-epimerase